LDSKNPWLDGKPPEHNQQDQRKDNDDESWRSSLLDLSISRSLAYPEPGKDYISCYPRAPARTVK
jgi:hypothetical protein